jgi:serine/threonine protein kinase/tetratricopeptide (TPR) repeat protein
MVGRTLAHYLIVEKIGAGGMGVVYRARDTQLERSVALKVVGEKAQVNEQGQARLMREARTASVLNHTNICTVYEAGISDGETYIAMELVEGQPLSSVIPENGLPVEIAIRYAVQIADALAHAHERGVVHRDLKSLNVMITPDGRLKVLDFGLAKQVLQQDTHSLETLTQTGVVVGTLPFMAPEILRGEPADARSDLWAMGVMLYHALTGSLPFRGATPFQVSSAIERDQPMPLPAQIPPGLGAIIQRLLAKQPGERYQRASEVRSALEAVQGGIVSASPARHSRRRWLWAAASLVGASALTWGSIHFSRQSPTEASGPRLSDGARASLNAEANEYYERALLFAGAGARHDPPQVRRMLERALALDPRFAAARSQYAFTNMLLVLQGDSSDPSWLYKAEEEARQALRDDPDCGLAHSALAGTYHLQGRKELVLVEAQRALKTNPDEPAVLTWLLLYHWSNGDYDKAMDAAKQIIARSPRFWPAHLNFGEMLRERGDTAGALRAQERILELDPQSRIALCSVARAYMDTGELTKARGALERIRPQDRKNLRVRLVWALLLAREGNAIEASREMDSDVQAYGGNSFLGPAQVAEFYSSMGDTAKAFEWLERATRMGDEREDWLRRDPLLAGIRDHPRFQQMLASVAYRRKQRPSTPTAY